MGSAAAGGTLLLKGKHAMSNQEKPGSGVDPTSGLPNGPTKLPDLSPARWIWYPSARCLQNTFVLFRRGLELSGKPRLSRGWISADSRYLLEVNGQRIQWGPAPCDPRWLEADPVDLTDALQKGLNTIGATVLHYGVGDGTWAMGKPGFLFWLEIESDDGDKQLLVSDASWKAHLCRAWPPGHYKRFFVRALQEEFDARQYPYGWTSPQFEPDRDWLDAMPLDCPPDKPPICSTYFDYLHGADADRDDCELRPRRIPLLREYVLPVTKLTESMTLLWHRPPEEYFECGPPGSFDVDRQPAASEAGGSAWRIELDGERGAALTFELGEQVVGWPRFSIDAPAGTVIELLVHEAHEPGGPALLNTHFQSWTRFTCRKGTNHFETFDYESCRWIQLHVHGAKGDVTIRDVGVRRRIFPWPHEPQITCGEPELQRLIDASINTLHNSCQDFCVDGMARERQQYSGDCGHQLHGVYLAFGETRLPERFVTTFSQGCSPQGYFLDCWPAYDRLARVMERHIGLSMWGPLVDHGIGFNFDCWHHYLYTGDLNALEEPYPRLLRFFDYLKTIRDEHGLLRVDGLGVPCVWIDHVAYQQQRHKQCAFNLYAAAMLGNALAPLCRAFADREHERNAVALGEELLDAATKRFWSNEHGLFVANRPWLAEESGIRLCDRSLATAILFDQCPAASTDAPLEALVDCPPEMGFSYPANANWRLWALAKMGRIDVALDDLRRRWATMPSVRLNNTLQEDWHVKPDSGSQWSHCAVAPLYVLYMDIAGIRPIEPGFTRCEIRPQLADIESLKLTARTVQGSLVFAASGVRGGHDVDVSLPGGCEGELVVRTGETVDLERAQGSAPQGHLRYRLPAGTRTHVRLQHA